MIVVLPMIAVGGLVFRLIGDSQQGKADARSAGLATAAASLYLSQSGQARTDAATIARDLAGVPSAALPARMRELQSASGVVRIEVRRGGRIIAASGARAAVAPGSASPRPPAGARLSVSVSTLSASDLVRELTPPRGAAVLIRQGSRTLAASLSHRAPHDPAGAGCRHHRRHRLRRVHPDGPRLRRPSDPADTDPDDAYAIAERIRGAIEALRVARLDGHGPLRITASVRCRGHRRRHQGRTS